MSGLLAGPRRTLLRSNLWLPTSLAGLKLWTRADVGVYQDAARATVAASDADPVGGWQDFSGAGNHLSQSTSTKRGTLKVNLQNGKPGVRFDGVDDFMDAAAAVINSGTTFTIFLVHKSTGDLIWASTTATNNQVRVGQGGVHALSLYDSANNPISLTAAPARTVWTMAEYQNGPRFWVNGVNRDNGGTLGAMHLNRFFIEGGGAITPFNGDVGEIVIYNTTLSDGDRVKVEAYLNGRWGLY